MKRGFALVIALAFFVLAGVLTSLLTAYTTRAGTEARADLDLLAARRAAEAGIRITLERLGQNAARSYFSDPIEAQYWFGGDLPAVANQPNTADGILAIDGEIFGLDTGMDGLPNILEPGFAVSGEPGTDYDPNGDDFNPFAPSGLFAAQALITEGNGRYDIPAFGGNNPARPDLLGRPVGAGAVQFLGQDDNAMGKDGLSSFFETTQVFDSFTGFRAVGYHPVRNPDPSGDDYHPIFNPQGDEGRIVQQDGLTYQLPTVEHAEARWRRHIYRIGPVAEFGEGKFEGYSAVRAVDTSSKIDLNGPNLLTARLIQGLAQMTGTSLGPVTLSNPAVGSNGRGFEVFRPVPTTVGNLGGPGNLWNFLERTPQFALYNNPAYLSLLAPIPLPGPANPPVPTTPQKIASSKAEEELYFSQPVNALDGDAVAIVKYRNQVLGGRFTSTSQLLEVRRADGTAIFDERSRDELLRLSQFLTVETWRDPGTISRRNGEPLMAITDPDGLPNNGDERFDWDPLAAVFYDPEPWQDLIRNGIFEGGERFNDRGLDNAPSASEPTMQDDDDPTTNPGIFAYSRFTNPDPGLDDFHTLWNPFFYRLNLIKGHPVATTRYGPSAWSPLASAPYYQAVYGVSALSHYHYSCYFSNAVGLGFCNSPKIHGIGFAGACRPWFNFDALEGNGFLDADPYVGSFPTGEPTAMWSEIWSASVFDVGTDQLNSRPMTPLARDEFIFNWPSPTNPDPNLDDASYAAVGIGAGLWGMRNPAGTEGNGRLDPYPEWGRVLHGLMQGDPLTDSDIPGFTPASSFYQSLTPNTISTMDLSRFLSPNFHSIPPPVDPLTGDPPFAQLRPPDWLLPDGDWYAESGEMYFDHGRDRMPRTFDFGEGNGQWDPGELFLDYGDDGRDDFQEMMFGDSGLTTPQPNPWQICIVNGVPVPCPAPGEYHNDNFQSIAGRARGKENDQRFSILREPYLDLNRNGRWDRGGTLRNAGGNFVTTVDPTVPATYVRNTSGAFLDRNGDRNYDRGFFIEPRAPVNVNAAPEEVLAAVLYQGLVFPCKKRQDRFLLTSFDQVPTLLDSRFDDYDWYTVVTAPAGAPFPSILQPDFEFSYSVARGVARAIVLRRLGLYWDAGGTQSLGSGPFRDWQEFEAFINSLISSPAETARFDANAAANSIQPNAAIPSTPATPSNPVTGDPFALPSAVGFPNLLPPAFGHTSPYPAGAAGARQLVIDRILVQANPNSRLLGQENYPFQNQSLLDKGDFPFPTTEFCFGPTGYYEITAVGYAVSGEPTAGDEIPVAAAVVGAGFAMASGDLLSSFDVRSQIEVQRTQKLFEHVRLSTRSDFEGASPVSHGVSVFPKIEDPKGIGPQTQIAIEELTGIVDGQRGSSPNMQSSFGPFLLVRPQVTALDPIRSLVFAASRAPYDGSYPLASAPWGNPGVWDVEYPGNAPWWPAGAQGPGSVVQLFDILSTQTSAIPNSMRNVPTNNGQTISLNYVNQNGANVFYRFGAITPGNGMVAAGGAPGIASNATIGALAFDPLFPEPPGFPNVQHFAGAWIPPGFVFPSEVNYLGRLYMLDNANGLVRAFDIGRDGTGGAITQEVQFCTGCNVGYGGLRGVAIQPAPDKREVYVLLVNDGTGQYSLRRLRYADAVPYPRTELPGNFPFLSWSMTGGGGFGVIEQLPIPVIRPFDSAGRPLFAALIRDPRTGYVYVGGSGNGATSPDLRIYRCTGAPVMALDRVFPMFPQVIAGEPNGPNFSLPGYDRVSFFPPVTGNGVRELVGLDIDPGSNLLFVLWNSQGLNGSGEAYVDPLGNPNGNGAYLAAVPIGAAPYLTVPLVNPFPMDLGAFQAFPPHAAAFAVDPLNKSIMIAPREQGCSDNVAPINPLFAAAPNRGAAARNQLAAVTYAGDGLRIVDPLFSPTLWTDYREFIAGVSPLDPPRPAPVSMLAFPGKNVFFLSSTANAVTRPLDPPLDGVNCNDQLPVANLILTQVTRSITPFALRGYEYGTANAPRERWLDGKIVPSPNAVPFSAFFDSFNPWIHSRASFEKSPFFMKPDYKVSTIAPTQPTAYRPIVTQVNAKVKGEGLFVDRSIPATDTLVDVGGSDYLDQRIYFPQDGVSKDYPISGANPGAIPNPESGWRILDGAGEFWLRLGDLRNLVPPAQDLVIYEHFQKAKAELYRDAVPPLPVNDDLFNPFLSLGLLRNYLGAANSVLGFPVAPTLPVNANSYFPNAIDVWAYDKILLRNILPVAGNPGQFTAQVVYQRRLAGPAGQYPGIYRPTTGTGGKGAWGVMPPSLEPIAPQDQFTHPFTFVAGDLSNPLEAGKYATVVKESGLVKHRFVPIWSAGGKGANEATVEAATIAPVILDSNGWMRVVYGSRAELSAGNLVVPSRNGTRTRVLVWSSLDTQPLVSPVGAAALSPIPLGINAGEGWFQFPADKEGFLAFGAYTWPVAGYPGATPVLGGPIYPGFSYSVDDVVLYESSQITQAFGPPPVPWARAVVRFDIGEGGWPVNAATTFPGGGAQDVSSFFPAEPFFDFNRDGTRNWIGNPNTPPQTVSIWDFNQNLRWDFGETLAFPSDASGMFPGLATLDGFFVQPVLGATGPGFGIYGEPFTDLDQNGFWTSDGDRFYDLNGNGVLDGETFQDNNGNRFFDAGDGFDLINDLNGNGDCDGGEPYVELNGVAGYQPREGESYTNTNTTVSPPRFDFATETFFDENRNGFYDTGEPFVSWSRFPGAPGVGGPQGGELYRENGATLFDYSMDTWIPQLPAAAPAVSGFPHAGAPGNVWGNPVAGGPDRVDWNNDGLYEPGGVFEGTLLGSVPAGSRLGALSFTQWRVPSAGAQDLGGRIGVDLDLRARDGRSLGVWTGVDMVEVEPVGGTAVFADESGIGLPISAEAGVRFRVRFFMPNPRMGANQLTHNSSPPILDDLSFTVILPQAYQQIVENRIVSPILIEDYARGRVAQ